MSNNLTLKSCLGDRHSLLIYQDTLMIAEGNCLSMAPCQDLLLPLVRVTGVNLNGFFNLN